MGGNPLDDLSTLHNDSSGLARFKTSSYFFGIVLNQNGARQERGGEFHHRSAAG
jgi:hypothetical protein